MTAKDAIKGNMDMALSVLKAYIGDLNDMDLMLRPAPTANHLAWQLGHLINSEHQLMSMLNVGAMPALPDGFGKQHDKAAGGADDPKSFLTKQQYLDLFVQQRKGTEKLLAELPDADLDKPGPERMRRLCPTVGSLLILVGNHPMMHAGQFATVRRLLGKPIVI